MQCQQKGEFYHIGEETTNLMPIATGFLPFLYADLSLPGVQTAQQAPRSLPARFSFPFRMLSISLSF